MSFSLGLSMSVSVSFSLWVVVVVVHVEIRCLCRLRLSMKGGLAAAPALELPTVQPTHVVRKKSTDRCFYANPLRPARADMWFPRLFVCWLNQQCFYGTDSSRQISSGLRRDSFGFRAQGGLHNNICFSHDAFQPSISARLK